MSLQASPSATTRQVALSFQNGKNSLIIQSFQDSGNFPIYSICISRFRNNNYAQHKIINPPALGSIMFLLLSKNSRQP
jgi:hypothetical protein